MSQEVFSVGTLISKELEENGDLEEDCVSISEIVSSSLSKLGRFGNGLQHMYHNLSLPSQNLCDVSVLCNYVHLQHLELPHNNIKDLSCVSHMPNLVFLDASHNEISDFFEFQPPKNLQEVNFSHNRMTKMKDLTAFVSLRKLDLDYNSFSEIFGLEKCCRLTHLSVAHNKVSLIGKMDGLPLTYLCLRANQLERIERLDNLGCLQDLDLSLNRITRLSGLQNLHLLSSLNLEKNQINEIQECKYIHDLLLLKDLNLLGNPVQEQPDYRVAVIFLLQHLTFLDQEKVTAEEKVESVNKYDPPLDVVAARDHMTNVAYQLIQPQVLYDSTSPDTDSPYPMLVLTGPQGCGKTELVHRLCQELSEFFGYGMCHTTRGPTFGEENGSVYHFVSEEDFQDMIHMGKFIQTMQYGGHRYGLSRDAVEDVAREGLVCCVHMELESVFSLKKSYFEPRCILLIHTKGENYIDHLRSCGLDAPAQIDAAVARAELYARTNRQHPGFFDNVIPCDDLEQAFQTLLQIVKENLLPENEDGGENYGKASQGSTSVGHNLEGKPHSSLSRPGSQALLSDSATALEPSGSYYKPYLTRIQPELTPQRTSAELASIRRREQLVREAIVGKGPWVYSQLFKSSSEEPCSSSALSGPSSAVKTPVLEPTVESIEEHASGQRCDTPPAGTDQLPTVGSPSDPGSNVKPILPPTPTGLKIPASPSPTDSPRPGLNPAFEERRDANLNA